MAEVKFAAAENGSIGPSPRARFRLAGPGRTATQAVIPPGSRPPVSPATPLLQSVNGGVLLDSCTPGLQRVNSGPPDRLLPVLLRVRVMTSQCLLRLGFGHFSRSQPPTSS